MFATIKALDTISTSASPSERITLILEVDNWVPSVSKNACLLCLSRRKLLFSQSMDYGGMVQFFSGLSFTLADMITALCRRNYDCCEIGLSETNSGLRLLKKIFLSFLYNNIFFCFLHACKK